MTSNELKELVKKHFSLVEADAVSDETINEEFAVEEETFGEIADINDAFVIKFPGDSLQVGDKVSVVTSEGQEMDAPDGEHELKDGTKIVTEGSVVKEIIGAGGEKALSEEAMAEDDSEEVVEEEMEDVADVVEEIVEEVIDEVKSEMEEVAPSLEEIVKEIADVVKEEMGYMKKKMAEIEAQVAGVVDAPAAEPVMKKGPQTDFKRTDKFAAFDVSKAKNADRISAAIRMMKKVKK